MSEFVSSEKLLLCVLETIKAQKDTKDHHYQRFLCESERFSLQDALFDFEVCFRINSQFINIDVLTFDVF